MSGHLEGPREAVGDWLDPLEPGAPEEYRTVVYIAATPEQAAFMAEAIRLLDMCSGDGGRKRSAGTKPPWQVDPGHEDALFRHLERWEHEKVDPDSGAHPLAHVAWRALAIAYQEGQAAEEAGPSWAALEAYVEPPEVGAPFLDQD